MTSNTKPSTPGKAKPKKKRSFIWRFISTILKIVIIAILAISFASAGLVGGAVLGYIKTAQPVKDDQLAMAFNKTTFIYDSKGNVIAKLTGKDNKDSEPLSEKDAPKFLKDAIVSIEDERFYSHNGIDVRGILNIGVSFIVNNGNPRGGSTITQQVVRNITGNTKNSLERKVQEWYAAVQLEKKLSKWQILELYMNISYWGHSCYGVESASKKYFGKSAKDLSLAQCALLAGITNSPGIYNPFTEKGQANAKKRQEIILKKMLELGKISQSQYDEAIVADLQYNTNEETKKSVSIQSYFVDQVISDVKNALMKEHNMSATMASSMIYNNGLSIYTTMDPDIQAAMDTVFTDDAYFPIINKTAQEYGEHPQASMVIIDVNNGQVKAMYGGYGKKEASNTLNRASSSLMARQPGSSIKPLAVYAPAIDMKLVTAATVIDDAPVYMMNGPKADDAYPTNYDGGYDGLTTVRNALKASVNVVAAKIWRDILGPDNSVEYLKKVGIDRSSEKYLSLVLGGLNKGVNPLTMASAYVPFAHKGMYYEPTTYTLVKDSDSSTLIEKTPSFSVAYSEQTASIMVDLMKEVTLPKNSTYPHSGTAAGLINEKTIGMPVAGKTGTTSNNIDKWFVGYTPYYSAATWYGYDNKIKPITLNKDEYNQAQKIWAAVMKKVHSNLEKKDFTVASGLVKKTICIYSGKIATDLCTKDPRGSATKTEYFIKGTEPRDDDLCTVHVAAQVCTASKDALGRNLLAGPNCPLTTIVEKVFIQRTVPYVPTKPGEKSPEDIIYELPAGEYCTVHGATAATTEPGVPVIPGMEPDLAGETMNPSLRTGTEAVPTIDSGAGTSAPATTGTGTTPSVN
ncbi:MAG: PBP1A family penicillin-binding protein [Clostridiales bacterium]|nr:PBP1A family penicillin-binding protein [Clostridiales bacterium]